MNGRAPLVDDLRALLRRLAVAGQGHLPGEQALTAELCASRPALREAMARLEAEGLISRRQGAETTINLQALGLGARFDQQVEFVDLLESQGQEVVLEVLQAGRVEVVGEDAVLLDVEDGAAGWRTRKRWVADGVAVVTATDLLVLPQGREPTGSSATSLFEQVRQVHGEPAEWEIVLPGAETASPEVGAALGLAGDAAVLTLDLRGVARSGRVLYRAREYHRPGALGYGFVRIVRS